MKVCSKFHHSTVFQRVSGTPIPLDTHPPEHSSPWNTHPPGTPIPLEHSSPWNTHPPWNSHPPGTPIPPMEHSSPLLLFDNIYILGYIQDNFVGLVIDEVDKMDHCNPFIKFYSAIIQIIDNRY